MSKIKMIILLLLLSISSQLFSQEMNSNGSMKLSEVSSDKDYGTQPNYKTSVKVGSVENEYAYLQALCGPHGEKIRALRNGSCCEFKSKTAAFGSVFLDKWEISYPGLQTPIIIYLNGYDYEAPKAPYGLALKTKEQLEKEEPFPTETDNILKVAVCKEPIAYAVKDMQLSEKIGNNFQVPDKSPEFEGGIKKLKEYFDKHAIDDENARKLVFRVHIAFVVTCDNKAGNFVVTSKGKGDLEMYANQVLDTVNEMPQEWHAAIAGGKPVDCYQVLSFTIAGGSLSLVSYR